MTLQNEQGQHKHTGKKGKAALLSPEDFFKAQAVGHPEAAQGVVFAGSSGAPNDHMWNTRQADFGPWAAEHTSNRKPAYFTMAAYAPDTVGRFNGRTTRNVVALRGFWVDIDVGDGHKQSGYTTSQEAMAAVAKFIKATGLVPSCIVSTGSGGLHLHFFLSECVTPDLWLGRAQALVALAADHGLNIDAQCTTDAARIMRAPGSIHQKTGEEVSAVMGRNTPYDLAKFDALVKYEPDALAVVPTLQNRSRGINADVLGDYPQFSYTQAAKLCPAMAQAAQHNGQDTPYPVWILAAQTATLATEGREFAHQLSSGHPEYDEAKTDKVIDSLTGGPANCITWETAYGAGGPCRSCAHRGTIKNPATQLGRIVETAPPDAVTDTTSPDAPEWVAEMNARFALVRNGSKMVVIDAQSPSMTARGVVHGVGYLELGALRSMLNGRYAPIQKAGERPRPLADAWLAHTNRRQYAGLVFAPGENLPTNILNLWQGFAVTPSAGEVAPWLEVLGAMVPDAPERRYVLRWLAWKVQNPGGVPDTVLIFKGAKGTGKNSLFDPLIAAFGRHAMLADDPELIAGRFTWHLMSLCLAVLDEAVFVQDPRQADRIKSRVTAKVMMYEQKGMDPVQGVNRCAYVILTNHEHVWQATMDERRAVVIEAGESLRGNLPFWERYHAWVATEGSAALLHYLQGVDLTGFNPRQIPKGEALRLQVEQTALRHPAVAWWNQCLTEGAIRWRDGGDRVANLSMDAETEIERAALRLSFEQSAAARGRNVQEWAAVSKRVKEWAGPGGLRKVRARIGSDREWREILPPLSQLREMFTAATQVQIHD